MRTKKRKLAVKEEVKEEVDEMVDEVKSKARTLESWVWGLGFTV